VSATGDHATAVAASEARLHSPQRLNALADGIFAIAMTLFALDVRVPEDLPDTPAVFDDQFSNLLSHFGVFAAAFFITARFWFVHHRLMSHVRRIDGATLQLTVVFLFGIASTPVASNALIRFGSVTRAVVFAALLLAFTSFMHLLVYRHVTNPRLGLSDVDPESRRAAIHGSAWVVGTFLLAIPLAPLLPEPAYAMLAWLVVPLTRRAFHAARGDDPPVAA
jgi:uncharacterized membrane protein